VFINATFFSVGLLEMPSANNDNGLITPISAYPTTDTAYFIRATNPQIFDDLQVNNLTAEFAGVSEFSVSSMQSVIPGQPINLMGTVLTNAGEPVYPTDLATKLYVDTHGGGGGGGVSSVSVLAPLTLTGNPAYDPTIGIDLSGIVRTAGAQTITGGKKFAVLPQSITGVLPTDPDEFTNKLYVDSSISASASSFSSIVGGISSITEWSRYPALHAVDMHGFNINNCGDITYHAPASLTPGVFNINSDVQTKIESAGNITLNAGITGDVILEGLATTILTGTLNVGSVGIPLIGGVGVYTSGDVSLNTYLSGNIGIDSAGTATIAATGAINIGSDNYTSIENMRITDSLIEAEPGKPQLSFNDVAYLRNDTASLSIGTSLNNYMTVNPSGQININTNNQSFTLNGGDGQVNFGGQYFNIGATSSIVMEVADGTNNPIEIRAGLTNNVNITEGLYDETTDPSSVLDVKSATRGMYIPRLTTAARTAIPQTQQGLVCFDVNDQDIYTHLNTGWAKTTLINESNELLGNLSGLASGTRTRTLTGFAEVDAGNVKVNTIEPLEPLVQPYVGIGADVAMPGNATLSFGAVGGGDGTISVPSGTLNVNADVAITGAIDFQGGNLSNVGILTFVEPDCGITSAPTGELVLNGSNAMRLGVNGHLGSVNIDSTGVQVNNRLNINCPILLGGITGPKGYMLISNGSGAGDVPLWSPVVSAPVSGRLTLGAISGDSLVPASDLIWDTVSGVLV
jgi:hypothetical protein